MSTVRMDTPRGVSLSGILLLPDGAPGLDLELLDAASATPNGATERPEGVVILAHDFLTDKHGLGNRLDRMAQQYRRAGLATLQFDFSGLGESDDDVVTVAGEVEDLQAVSGWLADRGYRRQAIHANGLGATAALLARPEHVRTAVVVGAVVGPQSILWENVFSPEQLDELDRHGLTRIADDNPNTRQWDVLSRQTLADVSMQQPSTVLAGLPWPVLLLHGALTDEFPDTADAASEGFALLPDGSRLHHVHGASSEEAQAEVARLAVEWVSRRLR